MYVSQCAGDIVRQTLVRRCPHTRTQLLADVVDAAEVAAAAAASACFARSLKEVVHMVIVGTPTKYVKSCGYREKLRPGGNALDSLKLCSSVRRAPGTH